MIKKILSHKRFIKLLKESTIGLKKELIVLVLGILLVAVINIAIPYFGGEITERFLQDKLNFKIIFFGIVIYIIKLCIQYYLSYNTNYLSGLVSLYMKSILINKYISSKTTHFDFIKSGDFHQRVFNETGLLQGKLIFGTIYFFKDVVFFMLLLINIYIISPLLFISLILFTILLYFFHVQISGKVSEINHYKQIENAKLSNFFLETIYGKDDILFFNLFDKVRKTLIESVNKIKKYIRHNSIFQGLSDVFLEVIIILFIISIIIILLQENMPLGNIITTIGFIVLLLWPLKGINSYLISLSIILPSVKRIEQVLKKIELVQDKYENMIITTESSIVSLELKNISFSYNNKEVFSEFSSLFKEGVFLITGKNGAGKSTLAKIILGVLSPQRGEIIIKTPNTSNLFGMVSQTPFLYNSSIKENLKINITITNKDIDELVEDYRLKERFNLDLNKNVGENGKNLSGGEKQIISILRCVIINPDILILDEITNNLPSKVYESLIRQIVLNRKNKITIIISHNLIQSIDFDKIIKI